MTAPLLESDKEEGAVFVQRSAQSKAELFPIKWRLGDRREGIACLKTFVSHEAKNVSLQFICSALGHNVHHTTSRTAKLGCERISDDLEFLHGFLTDG